MSQFTTSPLPFNFLKSICLGDISLSLSMSVSVYLTLELASTANVKSPACVSVFIQLTLLPDGVSSRSANSGMVGEMSHLSVSCCGVGGRHDDAIFFHIIQLIFWHLTPFLFYHHSGEPSWSKTEITTQHSVSFKVSRAGICIHSYFLRHLLAFHSLVNTWIQKIQMFANPSTH